MFQIHCFSLMPSLCWPRLASTLVLLRPGSCRLWSPRHDTKFDHRHEIYSKVLCPTEILECFFNQTLFGPYFIFTQFFFLTKDFVDQKMFGTKFFLASNFFSPLFFITLIFLVPYFFGYKIFGPNFFFTYNFGIKNLFDSKLFLRYFSVIY